MAKLNEEKILEQVSELPIDDQISFFEKLKSIVKNNVDNHSKKLLAESHKYGAIVGLTIEGNSPVSKIENQSVPLQ